MTNPDDIDCTGAEPGMSSDTDPRHLGADVLELRTFLRTTLSQVREEVVAPRARRRGKIDKAHLVDLLIDAAAPESVTFGDLLSATRKELGTSAAQRQVAVALRKALKDISDWVDEWYSQKPSVHERVKFRASGRNAGEPVAYRAVIGLRAAKAKTGLVRRLLRCIPDSSNRLIDPPGYLSQQFANCSDIDLLAPGERWLARYVPVDVLADLPRPILLELRQTLFELTAARLQDQAAIQLAAGGDVVVLEKFSAEANSSPDGFRFFLSLTENLSRWTKGTIRRVNLVDPELERDDAWFKRFSNMVEFQKKLRVKVTTTALGSSDCDLPRFGLFIFGVSVAEFDDEGFPYHIKNHSLKTQLGKQLQDNLIRLTEECAMAPSSGQSPTRPK